MPKIQVLDQSTINKIAAGEVVERPASVVKELVENAIDAGATAITVEVKEGGLKLIRITDNGSGIEKNQVRTAFLRHATSKIREATDLITIDSLGFRGEALASIAAVAMVELTTKVPADMTGVRYAIEGGQEKAMEDIGCPTGTTFVIKDLFFNTPARLKFMKTAATELGYVADLMNRLAMGHPTISFKFVSNGKVKLQTAGKDNLKDCIYSVFGKDVARNLIPIKGATEAMTIDGYIGKPHISRGNRTYENYFLNGRYIKSKVVEKAVEDAFKSKLMLHRYPFVAFHIEIKTEDVDVNVHPTKMDVRFMKEKSVYDLIFKTVDDALNSRGLIPEVKIDKEKQEKVAFTPAPEPFETPRGFKNIPTKEATGDKATEPPGEKAERGEVKESPGNYQATPRPTMAMPKIDLMKPTAKEALQKALAPEPSPVEQSTSQAPPQGAVTGNPEQAIPKAKAKPSTPPVGAVTGRPKPANTNPTPTPTQNPTTYTGDQISLTTDNFIDPKTLQSHKVVGQLFDTYWVVELDKKYYIIDQHAAHEKVLYEQMLNKIESKVAFGQRLLNPVVVQLTIQELSRYHSHQSLFADLGFEVEPFGEDAVIIRSVPFIFDKIFETDQFTQILDGLEDAYSEEKYAILLDDIATMSCKAAVKGNDRLSKAEYLQLIDDLLKLDNPFHCPHGRPTIIAMTQYELEKKFKRIV